MANLKKEKKKVWENEGQGQFALFDLQDKKYIWYILDQSKYFKMVYK